ncbi:hypothetical protein B4Q13_18520, partial [Lacticaseibacillus rhamnosus]
MSAGYFALFFPALVPALWRAIMDSLAVLKTTIDALRALPGRKSVILVSDGFVTRISTDVDRLLQRFTATVRSLGWSPLRTEVVPGPHGWEAWQVEAQDSLEWLGRLPESERPSAGLMTAAGFFVRRGIYGRYIQELLRDTMARQGGAQNLFIVTDTATALRQHGTRLAL